MKAVGIKALKNKLSEYIRLVREGEIVLVTDRDEVVAEISRPRTPVAGRVSRWEAFLNEEERAGRITPAKRTESVALRRLRASPPPDAPTDLLELLRSMREDRSP